MSDRAELAPAQTQGEFELMRKICEVLREGLVRTRRAKKKSGLGKTAAKKEAGLSLIHI